MPTPEQIKENQRRQAEADKARMKVQLPAKAVPTAVASNGGSSVQAYLNEIAPASIVGRMIKFSKDGEYVTTDNGEAIADDIDFLALVDQTLIGWIKFNGEGEPPDRVMGLLYDGWTMPLRQTLGDDDESAWRLGLDGLPQDPWQHHVYLVLQGAATNELFTFVAPSVTSRRAVGNLLRHYDRTRRTDAGSYPIVRLKVGGFQRRDVRVGWVKTPAIAVIGRTAKSNAVTPGTAAKDMNDELPI